MTKKTCFKCGEEKEIDDFYKHPAMSDGHIGKCKECAKKDVSKNYADKREYYAEYERERFKRPERKEAAIIYQRKRRAKDPDKYVANGIVARAIRGGYLIPQPCAECSAEKAQAHHEDYSEPLVVEWLCRKHHLKRHGKVAYEF